MRVSIAVTCASDEPFLVPKEAFLELFDQPDFQCRDRERVEAAYSEEWFTSAHGGVRGFLFPAVHFVAGRTQFISGRHRIAVLLPHLAELPIAFTAMNPVPEKLRSRLQLRPVAFIACRPC
jgi:hypothetical protein